jgi:Flp pilus assembly pilin Flp
MLLSLYTDLQSRMVWARGRVHTAWERVRDDRGAAGVEYGILVAAIAALIVVVAFAIGVLIRGRFEDVEAEIIAGPG